MAYDGAPAKPVHHAILGRLELLGEPGADVLEQVRDPRFYAAEESGHCTPGINGTVLCVDESLPDVLSEGSEELCYRLHDVLIKPVGHHSPDLDDFIPYLLGGFFDLIPVGNQQDDNSYQRGNRKDRDSYRTPHHGEDCLETEDRAFDDFDDSCQYSELATGY